MPIPFDRGKYITWNDIERCPYSFRGDVFEANMWLKWNQNDDKRLLLIALDRYANEIIENSKRKSHNWINKIFIC